MQKHTFLWHDYETFGANVRRDRPAQFAAIRTDADLNIISTPLEWYCQPAPDFLPEPQACLITGITPQHCLQRGIPEYQFAQQINQELSQPNTIGVGYNSIRFDDEITRFMLWRNLLDPYAREWQNQCGRWDILDMLRTMYALRPEGMVWPKNDENKASFRLEHLCAANGIEHASAHDALSDVRATIALARLVQQKQPKLFDFCFSMHKKEQVIAEMGLPKPRPFLHISGMLPAENGCMCIAWPLAQHPSNKNEIIIWDLKYDPRELLAIDAATIRLRLFSKTTDLPDNINRLPIKTLHINKSPIVIRNLNTLSPTLADQWNISIATALQHAEYALTLPDMTSIWQQAYLRDRDASEDIEQDLYNGFIDNGDRRLLQRLASYSGEKLATTNLQFQDSRLEELAFRYRARNFPITLTDSDRARWEALRAERFSNGKANAITVDRYFSEIDLLYENASERDQEILDALHEYGMQITDDR